MIASAMVMMAVSMPATISAGIGVAVVKAYGTIHEHEFESIERIDITPDAITIHHQSADPTSHHPSEIDRIYIGVEIATVGVNSVMDKGDIAVWPTQVESILNVKGLSESTFIRIYSLSGQTVKSVVSSESDLTIDLSNLPAGGYVVDLGGKKSVKIIKL